MIAEQYTFIYNAIMISHSMSKIREKSLDDNENLAQNTIKDSDVYELLLKIPAGKVSTYGDLAKALGNPLASREIGRILGRNPNPVKVPCHRVVMSDGKVGGYAYGGDRKRELLEKEGISFDNGIVSDFKKVRVYPQKQ
jgi:methylated-DNA-[protein]-cysteine S-methyltransferase